MSIQQAMWTVGPVPAPLRRSALPSEKMLEDMIVAAPAILSEAWMLIGRQERTAHNGLVDLLAIAPDGVLVLIELKRDRTPRDVIAQALDYASWVETLRADDVAAIYGRFRRGGSLAEDFRARFGVPLEDDMLDGSHQIVIVAGELDPDSTRIVGYLAERGLGINVLCFQVFESGGQQFLSRAWLRDDSSTVAPPAVVPGAPPEPWNGEYYANFGEGPSRSWEEARRYGFISAGGDAWYSKTLGLLAPGDRVWVKATDHGFVGVGRVTGKAVPATEFRLADADGRPQPALTVLKGDYHRGLADDPARCEWFVPVRWLETVPLKDAVHEVGLFGNQNSVCRPTTPKWRSTVDRLKQRFTQWDD